MQSIMQASEQGLALIRRFEGFSANVYLCPAGKPTIGYGHVVAQSEAFPGEIDEEAAQTLLKQDVTRTEQAICRLVEISLSQNQFDALVSFTYNVGTEAFETSTLLSLLNAENLTLAAQQFGRWVYGGGHVLPGLVARRQAEAALFFAPAQPDSEF